jgi:hypothetical protein
VSRWAHLTPDPYSVASVETALVLFSRCPVIVFDEAGLHRLMTLYCSHHERSRTHLSLGKDTPIPRPVISPGDGAVVAIPEVGGHHHRYQRRAARTVLLPRHDAQPSDLVRIATQFQLVASFQSAQGTIVRDDVTVCRPAQRMTARTAFRSPISVADQIARPSTTS